MFCCCIFFFFKFCSDGWVLLGLLFLATPSFLTSIGCLLVGLAYPAARSAALLKQRHGLVLQVTTAVCAL